MKTVLIHSGGMDSTVLLYHLRDEGHEVRTLSIDYGQRHRKELQCGKAIAEQLGVEHRLADIRAVRELFGENSLTSSAIDVPEGHYTEENMKATVVPNRNMLFLALATGWAIATKSDAVSYAAHSGDHAIYPDCREAFAEGMNHVMGLADWHPVRLHRPFVTWTKAEIVARGATLAVPFAETWSCYKGLDLHCGRCGTCVERREAFFLAGVPDPTCYDAAAPTVEEMISTDWKLDPC